MSYLLHFLPGPRKNRRLVLEFAETQLRETLAKLGDSIPDSIDSRIGIAAFVLYCLDLRIGQFFGMRTARRLISEAYPRFATAAGVDQRLLRDSYQSYARAFYSVDRWLFEGNSRDYSDE